MPPWQPITKDLQGSFNLTSQLVKQADDTYVLKADDHCEVSYTFKNTGTTDMKGYIELVDSVSSVQGLLDPEENDSNGEPDQSEARREQGVETDHL